MNTPVMGRLATRSKPRCGVSKSTLLVDGKTAKELVAENRGADVLRFLRSLDAGVAG